IENILPIRCFNWVIDVENIEYILLIWYFFRVIDVKMLNICYPNFIYMGLLLVVILHLRLSKNKVLSILVEDVERIYNLSNSIIRVD
ncbi:hypothetical protein Leryth_026151, partial [Lithospermum erythrorhizon]